LSIIACWSYLDARNAPFIVSLIEVGCDDEFLGENGEHLLTLRVRKPDFSARQSMPDD